MDFWKTAGKAIRSLPFFLYHASRPFCGRAAILSPPSFDATGQPEKILAIRLDAIGDLLMTTPALRSLKRRFPNARIDLLVQPGAAFAAKDLSSIDEVHTLPCNFLLRGPRRIRGILEWIVKLLEIRRRGYDLTVDFSALFHSAAAARASGARFRVGIARRIPLGFFHLNHAGCWYTHMTEPDDSIHISGQMLALPVALGGAGDGRGWDPPRNPDFARAAGKALEAAGVGPEDGPLVMLHPGAKWPPKRWAAENFAEVIDLLQEKGCRVAVIGGPGEEKIIETIRRSCRTSPVYLWPPEPMETIWGLMEKADAFVGNDSGPMHLAAAAGTPVVALFGPLSPHRYAPPGEGITIFYSALECSPCPMYFSRNHCHRGHNYCMDDFSPAEIAESVMRSIQSPALLRRSSSSGFRP